MLDPIINFIQRIFSAIGRGIGVVIAWILFPFLSASRWYASRGLIIKAVVGVILALLVIAYVHFVWITQTWSGFNPDYIDAYKLNERKLPAGQEIAGTDAAAPKKCERSAIVDVTADLIDMEVNQNTWITSAPLYKLGFFGLDWDNTPFLDNKASFQRGINQAVRRTTIELVDTLARVRATSSINPNLQDARQNMQYNEGYWYVGLSPFGFRTPTPEIFDQAITDLRTFNNELTACNATFDGRADNLLQFLDRISADLGSTSNILQERSEKHNAGWFDTRADDRFWFAYGQLYGYYGILSAARVDFSSTIAEKNLGTIWQTMLSRFRSALDIQPWIVSNGAEDGLIMPSHLATQGFRLLNARSSLVDIRDVLDR
jgi:hypothetical protein